MRDGGAHGSQRSDDAPLSARQNDRRTLVHYGCDRLAHGTRRLRWRVDQSVDIAEPKCAFDLSQSVVKTTEQPDQHIGQGIHLVGDIPQVPVGPLSDRALYVTDARTAPNRSVNIDHREPLGSVEQEFALFACCSGRRNVDPGPLKLATTACEFRILAAQPLGIRLDFGSGERDVGGGVEVGRVGHRTRTYQRVCAAPRRSTIAQAPHRRRPARATISPAASRGGR